VGTEPRWLLRLLKASQNIQLERAC
jgi:hypothetical protein